MSVSSFTDKEIPCEMTKQCDEKKEDGVKERYMDKETKRVVMAAFFLQVIQMSVHFLGSVTAKVLLR